MCVHENKLFILNISGVEFRFWTAHCKFLVFLEIFEIDHKNMPFGQGKSSGAKNAPDLGSFPLDHFKECTEIYQTYMSCLKQNKGQITPCRRLSMQYLQCRMDNDLMRKDDISKMGFRDIAEKEKEKDKETQKKKKTTTTTESN